MTQATIGASSPHHMERMSAVVLMTILVAALAIVGTLGSAQAASEATMMSDDVTEIAPSRHYINDQLPPPSTGGRRGLHFTAEELGIWRSRAVQGPYKSAGDFSNNSPGDWDRIVANKDRFMQAPMSGLWEGPVKNNPGGCVQQYIGSGSTDAGYEPDRSAGTLLRDAAFYALVKDDAKVKDTVRSRLLAQSDTSARKDVKFSDRRRWCLDVLRDLSPSFNMSHWMAQHLFAYDYLGRDFFTKAEQAQLDNWHFGLAELMDHDTRSNRYALFRDPDAGNYTPVIAANYNGKIPYLNPPTEISSVGRSYNNRRAAQMRYVALVGVHQDVAAFKAAANRYAKEIVQFSVYPQGFVGDFERWSSSNPELGLMYATQTMMAAVTIADVLARDGNTEAYDYMTTQGVYGSQGKPSGHAGKSLLFAAQALGGYVDGTYNRYGTNQSSRSNDPAYRIDGASPDHVHIAMTTQANVYYRDSYFKSLYQYNAPGMKGYPAKPASAGPNAVWTGDAGIYPGVLFMFGDMETKVWPYPSK